MADSDKLVGVLISGGTTTRVYGAYRIDYDDGRDISEIAGLDIDQSSEDYFGGVAKNPPEGYAGHEAKTNYRRKVICEDSSVRDAVQQELDNEGISYTTEDISPTADEQQAIEDWGAMNGLESVDALKWMRAVNDLSNSNITQAEYERGQNPNEGEQFDHPKGRRR